MTLLEIVEKHLKDGGYDGLYNPGECSCKSGDLWPCDSPQGHCEPGYLRLADPDESDSGFDWFIGQDKPEAK